MTFVEADEPNVPIHAVQFMGGFVYMAWKWPAKSWIVHITGTPSHRLAMTDAQFQERFPVRMLRAAAA